MPNRILKESICISNSIDKLTWFEEVLFYRLIVNCDDYGRFDGRYMVIKNRLFPTKDGITAKSIETAINKLVNIGLVSLYEFEGEPFLYLPTWNEHQSIRAKRSKYPAPDDVKSSEIICKQMKSSASKCSRNPIQSESNPIRIQSESNPTRAQEFESEELNEAWKDFVAMRKAIKKPLSEGAEKRAYNTLKKLAEPYNDKERYMLECLNQTIINGWQGLFEVKGFVDGKAKLPPPPPFDPNASIEERLGLHFD